MRAQDIVAAASELAGLSDFGDPAILQRLPIFLKCYEDEANRMRVEDWLSRLRT